MCGDVQQPGKKEIVREILAYLTDHPEAQDTLEGIVQWWLLERKIKFRAEEVVKAISELQERGFLLEHRGRGAKCLYRINKTKRNEIQALIASQDTKDSPESACSN